MELTIIRKAQKDLIKNGIDITLADIKRLVSEMKGEEIEISYEAIVLYVLDVQAYQANLL
jgi:hypothetical protein